MSDARELIGNALGRIPSGLFVVTFFNHSEQKPDGILMSWVQQFSFDPPMVSVAMNKRRESLLEIRKSAEFVVNVVGKKNKTLISKFYRGGISALESGEFPFKTTPDKSVILEDCVAYMQCQLVDELKSDFGDHLILLGKVVAGESFDSPDNEPSVHLRKHGYDY